MANPLMAALERSPVVAAVFSTDDLQIALDSPCEIIFLLWGNICELDGLIGRARENGKKIYVHLDLLAGLGKDQYTVQYLKETFEPDGILTTKSNIAKKSQEAGLFVTQPFFMLDSKYFETACKTVADSSVNAI